MLRIRQIEETIADRYKEQKMRCPVHLSIGQEAVAVGVCEQLGMSDLAVSGHRAHAHYLAKGGSLKKMMAEIFGKVEGCCLGRGGSMHLTDLSCGFLGSTPIVGGTIPIGVGAAFTAHLQKKDYLTVIFLGEGATEEGVFAECLNFASLKKLPLLFVCENNLYSVYSPLEVRQPKERNRTALAQAHGLFALEGDGNDVGEVARITEEAVTKIRGGEGPAYIEFATYRFKEHCGPNLDPFQPSVELEAWKKRDPLLGLEPNPILQAEIDAAFAFAEKAPYPQLEQEERPYA